MHRRFYMIAGAFAALVRHAVSQADRVAANPAVLEVLAVAVRKGLNSPEKVAFAYRSPFVRSRVMLHQRFTEQIGDRQEQMGADFQAVLRSIDAHLAFSNLNGPDAQG